MSRLPKFRNWRQHELFDRADLPGHVPPERYYADASRRRAARFAAEHKPIHWQGMASWVRMISAFGPPWSLSDRQRSDYVKTIRMLDVEKIRACRHIEDLELVEAELVNFRNNGLGRELSRGAIGELLVETRNRITVLRIGRTEPKPKGPRMDPSRLPDEALDRLIQRHPDMRLVEELRAERDSRRATI